MKHILIVILVCVIYFVIGTATKKVVDYPCESQVYSFLAKDSLWNFVDYYGMYNDTIKFYCTKDSSIIPIKAQEICKLFKDSCGIKGNVISFYKYSYQGKDTILYSTKCQ